MKIAIRYYTKTGNTKKLAQAISQELNVSALSVDVPIDEKVDILFLGNSVYAFETDPKVKDFIKNLDKEKVKCVVNFSTSAFAKSTYKQIKKLLDERQIPLSEKEFYCKAQFKFFNKGRPSAKDTQDVKKFANIIISNQN